MMKSAPRTKSYEYKLQVLDRAFKVLSILSDESRGVGFTELVERLQLHKSTTHRIVRVLEKDRFIEKDANAKYHLGSRIMELGLSAVSRLDVYEIAGPYLRNLVKETGETAHLAVLRDGHIVSIMNFESSQTLRTPATVGKRTPAHCTSLGKAMLAFASKERIEDFLRNRKLEAFTSKTITSVARLKAELKKTRDRGYAIDDQERELGLRCIGAPLWDSSGGVVAAISIAGPIFRIEDKRIPVLADVVMRVAAMISTSLGYRGAKR